MNTFQINFVPTGFTKKDLVWYSKYFWFRFYMRPRNIWRELKRLKKKEDFKRLWLAIKSFVKVTLLRGFGLKSKKQIGWHVGQQVVAENFR